MVLELTGQPLARRDAPVAVWHASGRSDGQRGGGVETANTGDKQGFGLTKRSKRRFEAQQMQVYLQQ